MKYGKLYKKSILDALKKRRTVKEVAEKTGIARQTVSKYITHLYGAGKLKHKKIGRSMHYQKK